ncbi:MAG: thiol-disulfide oxidoreductase DCC family protein [Flavobacteriaceae bacterium]|nr:thiol-disulfide oxidoreductase DCC family protein [Flavobacteriaceae bacterium]
MMNFPENKTIILFDGVCNLCNGAVNWLIRKDSQDQFRFVALQSDLGKEIVEYIGVDTSKTDSIIWYKPGEAYFYKSAAALKIAGQIGFPWQLMQVFSILPAALRDVVYDIIARNRYRWFGKKASCMVPSPELTSKFL